MSSPIALHAPTPSALPPAAAIHDRAGGENFTVASRLLRRDQREHLRALYGYARLVDELGDELAGDRLAALDWLEHELDRAYAGDAEHPLLRQLQPTLGACRLPPDPFVRLIDANRQDQRVDRYPTWERLRDYCHLSADPVGELVLHVFDAATPERIRLSNSICTALQLIEHCQDVAEDRDRGRIYVPVEDLARFGVSVDDLAAGRSLPEMAAVIAFEAARARKLFDEGAPPLIASLRGRARVAVAAFAGGGYATLRALEANGYEVMAGPPRASRRARGVATLRLLGGALR